MFQNFVLPHERSGTLSARPEEPTVFIVDDDTSIREALEKLTMIEGWRARAFDTAGAFLELAPAGGPSCLVLGINLPDLNGLELQALVAGERTNMPIIFATGQGEISVAVKAMKAGAVDFLTTPFGDGELLNAIERALERSRTSFANESKIRVLRDRHALLSRREKQVMALVVSGLLNKQAGSELGISEITVKAHRGRMMRKMKARSLPELVAMAAGLGLTN